MEETCEVFTCNDTGPGNYDDQLARTLKYVKG